MWGTGCVSRLPDFCMWSESWIARDRGKNQRQHRIPSFFGNVQLESSHPEVAPFSRPQEPTLAGAITLNGPSLRLSKTATLGL